MKKAPAIFWLVENFAVDFYVVFLRTYLVWFYLQLCLFVRIVSHWIFWFYFFLCSI